MSAQDAATNTLDTIDSTIATNDKYKYNLQDIMAEIKSLKINKNKGVNDKDIELGVKLVKKSPRIRRR
jgi:hypothetical protein